MTALSCDDLADQVIKADCPLLLLDTCVILDIVQAPIREQMGVHEIEAVHTVIERSVQAPSKVSLVIAKQVEDEFLELIDAIEKDTHTKLRKSQDHFSGILKRIEALFSTNHIPNIVDFPLSDFPAKCRQLAEQIVQTSTILAVHDDDVIKAYQRVKSAIPPAKKGKQSMKDCQITESYLRLSSVLCGAGFSHNIIFATSNSEDYQQGHNSLHPALRTEFEAVRLEYSPNWSAARHEIDRQRIYESGRENVIINSSTKLEP